MFAKPTCIEPNVALSPSFTSFNFKTPCYPDRSQAKGIKLNSYQVKNYKFKTVTEKDISFSQHKSKLELLTIEKKWTKEEDKLLLEGLKEFGRAWLRISTDVVITRTPAACIKRAKSLKNV